MGNLINSISTLGLFSRKPAVLESRIFSFDYNNNFKCKKNNLTKNNYFNNDPASINRQIEDISNRMSEVIHKTTIITNKIKKIDKLLQKKVLLDHEEEYNEIKQCMKEFRRYRNKSGRFISKKKFLEQMKFDKRQISRILKKS